MINLDSIPKSHRAFFVKKVTQYPSGFGRSCPMRYDEPRYYVMKRPVDWKGNRDPWFNGGKVKEFAGPFIGDEGKRKAEEIARISNEDWHSTFA